MKSSIWFAFAVLAIALVHTKKLEARPQTFADKTQAEQKPQKRETKEIEVYLTPSQIKALQEIGGYINTVPDGEAEASQENQEETEQEQQEQQEEDDFQLGSLQLDSQLEENNNQVLSSITAEEPTSEELDEEPQSSGIYRPPQDKTIVPSPEDNYAYLPYYPENESETDNAQPESEEIERESEEEAEPVVQQQRFRLVPYGSATEPSTTEVPQEDLIREHWLRLLEQNRAQLRKTQEKVATAITTTTEQPLAEPETALARLRFSARYNDQKQAIKNEEQRRKEILQKQKAPILAKARANNAPAVARKEVKTKQGPLIKHVKVHTPILVPIPEPFEVKVPHPYPVPLENFRPIATKATKAKKADAKKSSAVSHVEEKPKAPKKLSTTTGKPAAERLAPAEFKKEAPVEVSARQRSKPESLTIIRHVFEN